ncbi:hypothetical protein N3K66_008261 [Trichothecium roseum]|uniref:Uncharacterized protein n=1 Tax=Trichothecium roseum TaxID=47278 RepID=A0ACC0UUQ8_9HYPO|nr:hypothetical protein N3K66_008261 [Trichothecium roseum]
MTTAHRPTFDPAQGKEALRGPAYHQRLLPAHTHLKYRRAGQGGAADDGGAYGAPERDLAAELLAAEKAHYKKRDRGTLAPEADGDDSDEEMSNTSPALKRAHDGGKEGGEGEGEEEDMAAKRRRILAETRDIDKDDSSEEDDDDDDDDDSDDSDDDEDAELQRELARVRREREEKKKREEEERLREEQDANERNIALGNPLLNKQDFTMKRRWDDDVVFKNQARGTEDKKGKEFINDMLRSDFHRRFMGKYVR